MQKILWEIEQQMPDPDIGETLRPEIAEYLRQSTEQKGVYHALEAVKRELDLEE